MGIRRIQVENFKSYRNLDVTLGRLNVLIGANASGKSNFVEIFRFLHDIATYWSQRRDLPTGWSTVFAKRTQ